MSNLTKAMTLALALPFAVAANAQTTTAPATQPPAATAPAAADTTAAPAAPAAGAEGLSMGKDVVGSTYVKHAVDDWQVRCVHTKDGNDPCEIFQLLNDDQNNPTSEFSVFPLAPGGQAVAGATILTPLETLLTQDVTIQVAGSPAKRYPFTWCNQVGCFARVGFTAADLDAFKKGSTATLSIVPMAAPDQRITLNISLKGFTAGYQEVEASNAALRAAAQKAAPAKN